MPSYKPIPSLTLQQREGFWARVAVDMRDSDACWPWTASLTTSGYGQVRLSGRMYMSHRVAFTLVAGAVPDSLTIDHLCRNRACCNPAHMEAVPWPENVRRGNFPQYADATHCVNGHEFSEVNTYHRKDGKRACRTCDRIRKANR